MVDVVESAVYRAEAVGTPTFEVLFDALLDVDSANIKLAKSTKDLTAAQATLNTAENKTTVSVTNVGKAVRSTADSLDKIIQASDKAAKANAVLQTRLEAINRIRDEGGDPDKAAAAILAANKAYEDQMKIINRVQAVNDNNKKSVAAVNTEHNNTVNTIKRVNVAHNDNQQQMKKSEVSAGQLRYATQNLTFQINDVVTSLASGAPPMRVFAQQAGQIVQVFQQGGGVSMVMSNFANQLAGLASPGRLAVAAVLAIAAGIGIVINRIEDLKAANRAQSIALGPIATPENIEAVEAVTRQFEQMGLSFTEANKQALVLARNPMLNPQNLNKIAEIGGNVAAALGSEDVTVGVKTFTDALKGGIDAVIRLGSETRALDQNEALALERLSRQKGEYAALNAAVELYLKNLRNLRDDSLTPMQKAVNDMSKAWNNFLNELASSEVFQLIHTTLIQIINDLTKLSSGISIEPGSTLDIILRVLPGINTIYSGIKGYNALKGSLPSMPDTGTGAVGAAKAQQMGATPAGADLSTQLAIQSKVIRSGDFNVIADVYSHAIEKMGDAFTAVITDVGRPGGSPSRVGMGSAHVGGGAGDFKIFQAGVEIPNKGPDVTGAYTKFYNEALAYAQYAYPDVAKNMVAGARFDVAGRPRGSPGYQADLGHIRFSGGSGVPIAPGQPLTGKESFPGGGATVLPDVETTSKQVTEVEKASEALRDNAKSWNNLRGAQQEAKIKYDEIIRTRTKDLGETEAIKLANVEYDSIITKATADLLHYNQEQSMTAKGLMDTTAAYEDGIVPGLQAAAEAQANLAKLQNPLINAEERKKQILTANATQALATTAAGNAQANIAIKHEKEIATAAGVSAAALHDKQVEVEAIQKTQEVYNAALATGNTALIAAAKKEQDLAVMQAKRLDSLKQTTAAQTEANKNIDQTAVIQKTIELQGKTSEEIQYQVTLLQIRQRLANEFANASPEARKRFEETSTELAKVNLELARAQREQQKIDSFFVKIGDTIDENITKRITDAFDGKKAESFATSVKNAFKALIPQIISGFLVRPVIGSILNSLGLSNAGASFGSIGGTIGGIANLAGAGGGTGTAGTGSGGSGSLSTLFQGGGLLKDIFGGSGSSGGLFSKAGDFLNNTIGANIGFTPTGPLAQYGGLSAAELSDLGLSAPAGALIPSSLGATLGGIGAGFTAGTLLNSVVGGNQVGGTVGSGVGSIAGALIGSFTPLGPLGGALLGGLAGGGLGGLFGSNRKPDQASGGVINLGTGRISNVQSGGNAQNDQTASQIGTALAAAVTRALAIPGAQLPGGAVSVQAGSRDGIKLSYAGRDYKFADAGSAITAGLIAIRDNLTGVSDVVHSVLANISDPSQIEDALAFAAQYEKINDAFQKSFADVEKDTNVMGPFATAMQQIKDLFQQLTDQSNKFGLSLDPINAALEEATRRLQGDFLKSLDAAFNTATQKDFLNQLEQVAKARDQLYTEANAIGIPKESISDRVNTIAAADANEVLKNLTEAQLGVVVDAMRSTRPEFADMAQVLIDTARAADSATKALAANTLELDRQAFAYQAQQDFDTANGEQFRAQLRDFDKNTKALLAQLGPLNFAEDSYQASLIKETQHKNSLKVLTELNNDQMESARQLLEQLNPAWTAWIDEAKAMQKAALDAAAAAQAQADAQKRATDILNAQIAIQQYLNSLQTNASPFTSPTSRLAAAGSQFNTQLGKAQGGDVEALQGIVQTAQTYLQTVQDYYGSSQQGQQIFKQVQEALQSLVGDIPQQQTTKTLKDVVDTLNDNQATSDQTSNTNTAIAVQAAIDSGKMVTDASIQSGKDIVSYAKTANDNIVQTTNQIGGDITQAALDGSASIVGASAITFKEQNDIIKDTSANVVGATDLATVAVNTTNSTVASGTVQLIEKNAANALDLIKANETSAKDIISGNVETSNALQTNTKEVTKALMDQDVLNAQHVVDEQAKKAAELIAKNAEFTQKQIDSGQRFTDSSILKNKENTDSILGSNALSLEESKKTYNDNTTKIVNNANEKSSLVLDQTKALTDKAAETAKLTGDWGKATVDTVAAWGNDLHLIIVAWFDATNKNISGSFGWLNDRNKENLNALGGIGNTNTKTIVDNQVYWDDLQLKQLSKNLGDTVYWLDTIGKNIVNIITSTSINDIAAIADVSLKTVAGSTAAGNGVVAQVAASAGLTIAAVSGGAGTIAAAVKDNAGAGTAGIYNIIVNLRDTNVAWFNSIRDYIDVYGKDHSAKISSLDTNNVSWNQTLYNVIEREGNETQGFLNDIREHLRVIREYINLLTEVTIQFDEFSAGYMKADVGTMQDIERNLRRQAFGG